MDKSKTDDDSEEKTRHYERNSNVSGVHESNVPGKLQSTSRPGLPEIPQAPALPTEATAQRSGRQTAAVTEFDPTRGYSPETIEELLRAGGNPPNDMPPSISEGDTLVDPVQLDGFARVSEVQEDALRGNRTTIERNSQFPVQPAASSGSIHNRPIALQSVAVALAALAVAAAAYISLSGKTRIDAQADSNSPGLVASSSNISVSISASPADATITLDGVQVPNPYLAQRHKNDHVYELKVDAPGYTPMRRKVQFERDVTVLMALAPLPLPAAVPRSGPAMTPEPSMPKPTVSQKRAANARAPAVATKKANATNVDCDPPYTLDEMNVKIFKRECL